MSDEPTPRTDAVLLKRSSNLIVAADDLVFADFARGLERENTRLLTALEGFFAACSSSPQMEGDSIPIGWNQARLNKAFVAAYPVVVQMRASPETKQRAG